MLEKLPETVGAALQGWRAGVEKLVIEDPAFAGARRDLELVSPAFHDGDRLPIRHTQDGEGLSPALCWPSHIEGCHSMVLILEDPDAPGPEPLAHLIAWNLPPTWRLEEGAFPSPRHPGWMDNLGRNSFLHAAYLPPDPPPGHGPHRYVFQLFALNRELAFKRPPRRKSVVKAMEGHVLACGRLTGTYERIATRD